MAVLENTHQSFVTTTRGLRREIPPMILWERAKKLGVWNPADLDFSKDGADFQGLTDNQKTYVLYLASQFIAGEEAVTLDLLPLIQAVASQGHLEEEMFLTTFLWEEAKHIDFFSRAMASWGVTDSKDLSQYHTEAYKKLFYVDFPQRMMTLYDDPSPANMVRASTTYNLAIEGILAETGYYSWFNIMDENKIMPGTRQGVRNIQMDESRHIAYGVFLLSRLIAEDPSLFDLIHEIMDDVMQMLVNNNLELEANYGEVPFNFSYDDINNFAMGQYQKRINRIEKSKGKTLEELYKTTDINAILEEAPAT